MSRHQSAVETAAMTEEQERVWEAFRRWGYLQADLDPLGDLQPVAMAELEVSGPDAEAARRVYCGSIGVEFMHMPEGERRRWIQERMETEAGEPDRARILDLLVRAEIFEQVLQTRYLGTKRYSLEGEAGLLPLLDAILSAAAEQGAEQAVLAMSHRGRLNVMVHTVGRGAAEVFARFEDVDPRSVLGGGDVKYHQGATGDFQAAQRAERAHSSGVEPEPSGGGGSGGDGANAGEADAQRRGWTRADRAGAAARRCGVFRAGHLGRDAEHGGSGRIHGGRIGSRDRE